MCYSVVNTGSRFVCSLYRNICSWQFVLWLWASCLAPCVALVWTPASRNSQSGSAHKFTAQQVYTLDAAIELYHWCLYVILCAALDLRQNYFVDQLNFVQSGGRLKWTENESPPTPFPPPPALTLRHTVLPALNVNHLVILASPKKNFWNKLIIFFLAVAQSQIKFLQIWGMKFVLGEPPQHQDHRELSWQAENCRSLFPITTTWVWTCFLQGLWGEGHVAFWCALRWAGQRPPGATTLPDGRPVGGDVVAWGCACVAFLHFLWRPGCQEYLLLLALPSTVLRLEKGRICD